MDEVKLEVKGYYSLLNLHKALLEAKFNSTPDNFEVGESPIIAQLCKDITELLIQHELDVKGIESWSEWLKLKNRPDYRKRVLQRMRYCINWDKMDSDAKRTYVLNCASPFTCTGSELEELIFEFESGDVTE